MIVKLESNIGNSSEEEDSVFGDALEAGDIIDIGALPCENPILNSWGVAVFGREVDPTGNPRSASTAVNRIEFPDHSSTLRPVKESAAPSTMVWEDGTYTGYRLNCHKKKRKVESLIELYDKNCVSNVQDEKIFLVKLAEISAAALEAVEYMNEIIAELEINEEEQRITEIKTIRKLSLTL